LEEIVVTTSHESADRHSTTRSITVEIEINNRGLNLYYKLQTDKHIVVDTQQYIIALQQVDELTRSHDSSPLELLEESPMLMALSRVLCVGLLLVRLLLVWLSLDADATVFNNEATKLESSTGASILVKHTATLFPL
jgi:hypothetical protein